MTLDAEMGSPNAADPADAAAASAPAMPLGFHRLDASGARDGSALAGLLGERWMGAHEAAIEMPLLWPRAAPAEAAIVDAWTTSAPVAVRRHRTVQFATDGHWLHGHVEIDDTAAGLEAAAYLAYSDCFEVLAAHPGRHLLRVWNYFAHINRETEGVERYRQFNVGRQRAFLEARQQAFEGAPAACALGTAGGPLRVSFLAGSPPPSAIENPRQVSAYRYPVRYGSTSPTFSRAALADVGAGRYVLIVSGTASIVGHQTLHPGDVRRQTQESLANIAALRAEARRRSGLVFDAAAFVYTVYVRHAGDLPAVREVFEREVSGLETSTRSTAARGEAPSAVFLQADICRADLMVEIEAHGFAVASAKSAPGREAGRS